MNSITIGVTGHRDIVITENLKDNIKGFFIGLKSKYIKLLSPLADGADRLVADIYLDVFRRLSSIWAVPYSHLIRKRIYGLFSDRGFQGLIS